MFDEAPFLRTRAAAALEMGARRACGPGAGVRSERRPRPPRPWRRSRAGGKVLAFGNGGSAAAAQHLTAELVGRFLRNVELWPPSP